ncbi:hypothetical protein L195_g043659 [Trifolium pratense]|uniref:DUF7745 domain-containing protein n=1 Tax=Trifolium pratense TaxID=57577 RepID=A0A2K3M9V9_TRIPR|nr:hypothetical protein L195_g043659 [Trifolium pratense]
MAPEKRFPLALKAKIPDMKKLQQLSSQMTTLAKNSFQFHYGLLLDLLHVKINANALITLAQFYDPPLRCFTFQDFQLAPTLEEFAKILGCKLEDTKPYLAMEEEPTMEALSKALHLDINEVISWLVTKKNGVKVIPKEILEAKASDLLIKKEWGSFNAVLALLMYGMVLFPKLDGFIDMAAIGVFMDGNPVHSLLADFHLSLCSRHEKERGGTTTCCAPLM